MSFKVPGGTIKKGETIRSDGWSWPDGSDMGAQFFACRPAVHDCRLVISQQTKMFIQEGSRLRWQYGFTVTNEGWTDTYYEVEGGGFV
jgi:hypothetical protein